MEEDHTDLESFDFFFEKEGDTEGSEQRRDKICHTVIGCCVA